MLVATFVVAFAFSYMRLSVVLPYVWLASAAPGWDDWWVLTFLLVVFSLANELYKSLQS